MQHRILIFGASGSGTTTLGIALAQQIGARHLESDLYFWRDTDPPYTEQREPKERSAMLLRDTERSGHWVLSGSVCGWGDAVIPRLSLAVFLHLGSDERLARLKERELSRFGARVQRGGDMYRQHLAFLEWATNYDWAKAPKHSLDLHQRWKKRLPCPVLDLCSTYTLEDLSDQVRQKIDATSGAHSWSDDLI